MTIIEIIKAVIRPFLVVSFSTLFLIIVWKISQQYLTPEIASKVFDAFTYTMTLIIGVYIGGRIKK
jgi:ABC-type uncharacterized transport system permease subunit